MNKQIAVKTREKWVDDVKVIACILVALGHFFMSICKMDDVVQDLTSAGIDLSA